jgi:hypothetical protein
LMSPASGIAFLLDWEGTLAGAPCSDQSAAGGPDAQARAAC